MVLALVAMVFSSKRNFRLGIFASRIRNVFFPGAHMCAHMNASVSLEEWGGDDVLYFKYCKIRLAYLFTAWSTPQRT
jgi:hypothetical protein